MFKWNLLRLCEALHPAIDLKFSQEYVENEFDRMFFQQFETKMG